MEGWKIKYEDIRKLYNFIDITDKYILLRDKDRIKKIYIYEVEPVTFLNFSIEVQSNILNLYSEFLRELNFNFQIYISNKKVNIQKYISNLQRSINKDTNESYSILVNNYLSSIESQLEKESIYTTKFYFVISLNRENEIEINSLDNIIKKLDTMGCNTRRIANKRELKNLLYECINKEVVI